MRINDYKKNQITNKKIVLGVKRLNFIVYTILFFLGILFILIKEIINLFFHIDTFLLNVMFTIGCGIIPNVLLAYLIDLNSTASERKKILSLRKIYIDRLINGLIWIMKCTIENFYKDDNCNNKSFKELFYESIKTMNNYRNSDSELFENMIKRKKFLRDAKYGFDLCDMACSQISGIKDLLLIEEIFTEEELLVVETIFNYLNKIKKMSVIVEIAEYLNIVINNASNKFKELNCKIDTKVVLKKRQLRFLDNYII